MEISKLLELFSNDGFTSAERELSFLSGKYFCSLVIKPNNPIWDTPNIYPHVFHSFHRIIIQGESHRIFTYPPSTAR